MNYNLLYQTEVPKEMRSLAGKENITIVAYRPIERGLLADDCENETVIEIANKYNKTTAQIALNWLVSQEKVVTIPKSTDKEHIDENLGALDFEMSEDDLQKLNELA